MAKREPDKLAIDMVQCKKDGYGCHYGKWKALQKNPLPKKKVNGIPEGWKHCKRCGKPFKPSRASQLYCEAVCQAERQRERDRKRHNERQRQYRERKKAERMQANEQQ